MKYVYTALMALLFLACNEANVSEPAVKELPNDAEQLKTLLNQTSNSLVKLEILYALYQTYKDRDPEKARSYLTAQKELAEKTGEISTAGKACYNLGLTCYQQSNYIDGIDFYLKAITYFEKDQDTTRIASVLNNIGVVFMETGNYEYAEKFFQKAKETHDKLGDTRRQALANLNLAICSWSKKESDYDQAQVYYNHALQLCDVLADHKELYFNWVYNSIGAMNYKREAFEQAKENYLKSLDYVDTSADINELKFTAYSNISESLMAVGKYNEAEEWMKKAFILVNDLNVPYTTLNTSYNILAQLYIRKENYHDAADLLENVFRNANKHVINPPLQESVTLISQAYRKLNLAGKAVEQARYDKAFEINNEQNKLQKEFTERINHQALQAALGVAIQLDKESKARRSADERRKLISTIAFILGILMITGAIVSFIYITRYLKTKRDKNNWKRVGLHVLCVLESEPNIRPEDVIPPSL